jgi:hypothetical protein
VFDPDGQDLLLLQPGQDPIQHPGLAPPVHPGVDGVPIAQFLGQTPPFATMLHHMEQRVEQLQIGYAHIAPLARQAIGDPLILTFSDLHAPKNAPLAPKSQLVLTHPSPDIS